MWLEILIFVILGLWLAFSIYLVIKHRKTGGCCGDCSKCGLNSETCDRRKPQ